MGSDDILSNMMDKDKFPDLNDRRPDIQTEDVLMMEYQEVGEEWRTHSSLVTKSYYLSAILFTFFIGSTANLYVRGQLLLTGLVCITGGGVFVLLSITTNTYYERRNAASDLRTQVSKEIHQFAGFESPRIQRDVVGREPIEDDREYRPSGKGRLEKYFKYIPALHWLLFLIGVLFLLLGGVLLLTLINIPISL